MSMTHPPSSSASTTSPIAASDAKETVEWYARVLGMTYTTAFAEDHVPSTGEYDPYMHIFLDAGNGNILAFFELPNQPEMGKDPNTPAWVQHLALEGAFGRGAAGGQGAYRGAGHRRAGADASRHLQVDLLLRSQRPPGGTRLRYRHAEQYAELKAVAPVMLEEWYLCPWNNPQGQNEIITEREVVLKAQ
jgi:catechol 2,3-dioxygenase-like lactoylglutathione lyase family enzyme